MLGFVVRRVLATIPVLAMVAIFVFLMLRLTPGDPAAIIAGDNANSAQIAEISERLGLDRPIPSSSRSGSASCCRATSANPSSSRPRSAS